MGDTAFVRGSHTVWRRFTSGWRDTPGGVRRRWLRTLGIGLVICMIVNAATTVVGRQLTASGALDWERAWLLGLEQDERFTFHTAIWLEGLGSSAMVMPLVAVATILAALSGRPLRALLVLASYFPAKLLIFTGWTLWDRARPDFIAEGLAVPGSLHSFPSGHTLQTVTAWGLLVWFWHTASRSALERVIAWVLLVVLVTAIALARLRLGTHWPSDIVAGLLIGGAWLAVLAVADTGATRASAEDGAPRA